MRFHVSFQEINEFPVIFSDAIERFSFQPSDDHFNASFHDDSESINIDILPVDDVLPVEFSGSQAPYYAGSYEVTPRPWLEQTLRTRSMMMSNDIVVHPIPVYEVSNPNGTTINIGG